MAISSFIQGITPVITPPCVADLHQCGAFGGEKKHFEEQNFFVQNKENAQRRANLFFQHLERNLIVKKGTEAPLQRLLNRALSLSDTKENNPIFTAISRAFFKEHGYLFRLFSHEPWEEWTEKRTALRKVASQLRDYIEGQATENAFMGNLEVNLIQQANEEATTLLSHLDHLQTTRTLTTQFKSSCIYGFIGGVAGSFLTKNPFPLLLGLSECVPRGYAQQLVGNEFQVNTYNASNQWLPSVAGFPNGNFVVTWQSEGGQDGNGSGIYDQLFDENGTKIGNEFQVNTYTSNHQGNPSVTSFTNGNFIVAWTSIGQDGDLEGIYGQLFDGNNSKKGNEFRVNTYITNRQGYPSVASFRNGNFIVTWQSDGQDGDLKGIYGQLFDGNASNIGNEFQINTYITNDQGKPSVASFINGNFVVTWHSWNQISLSFYDVFGQLFDGNGSKIGNEFQVNTFTNVDQWRPSVASFTNGNFVATWISDKQDGEGYGIFGQLFDGNGSKIGNEFQINTYISNYQGVPSVATFANGNFVATWWSNLQDGDLHGIYGQLFDVNGSKIRNEFQVNTYTTNNQKDPSVASLSNGNFVVTWWSDLQDGSGFGIYGQIFHDNSSSTLTTTSTTTLVPTSSTNQITSTISTINTVSTSSTSQTTSTTGTAAISSSVRSSSISSSVVPTRSSSSNSVNTSKTDREKSQNVGLVIGVSLVAVVSLAACVAIIGLIILRRRKKEDDSGVELATRVAKQKKEPKVTVYGSLNGVAQLPADDEGSDEVIYDDLSNFIVQRE